VPAAIFTPNGSDSSFASPPATAPAVAANPAPIAVESNSGTSLPTAARTANGTTTSPAA
jgi:hypothetical protein